MNQITTDEVESAKSLAGQGGRVSLSQQTVPNTLASKLTLQDLHHPLDLGTFLYECVTSSFGRGKKSNKPPLKNPHRKDQLQTTSNRLCFCVSHCLKNNLGFFSRIPYLISQLCARTNHGLLQRNYTDKTSLSRSCLNLNEGK